MVMAPGEKWKMDALCAYLTFNLISFIAMTKERQTEREREEVRWKDGVINFSSI
jgi:hypothetical protein